MPLYGAIANWTRAEAIKVRKLGPLSPLVAVVVCPGRSPLIDPRRWLFWRRYCTLVATSSKPLRSIVSESTFEVACVRIRRSVEDAEEGAVLPQFNGAHALNRKRLY